MSRRPLLQHDGIEIARDDHGVPHVRAPDQRGALWGLGWCHAVDRGMQMLLMRILGRGRLAETLDPSDAGVAVDTFFRRMNWSGPMPGDQDEALPPAARALLAAFCDGVNVGFARHLPWEQIGRAHV